MTPASKWKWFGSHGHLIVGFDCRFHMCTKVGVYLVSTVGEYFPDEGVREIIAKHEGVELEGRGDNRRADFMRKVGFEKIGFNRTYETMVFEAGAPCVAKDCGCGQPAINGDELEAAAYNNRAAATKGHYEICLKYSQEPSPQS